MKRYIPVNRMLFSFPEKEMIFCKNHLEYLQDLRHQNLP